VANLWALQQQTDADMIRDATRCLESACQTVLMSRVEDSGIRGFVQRLPPFDRGIGQWRMLVELSVIPERLAEAIWKLGELDAAIAVRSGTRRFRLKDLPVAHYLRLGRTFLGSLLGERSDRAVSDEVLVLRLERSAAAFIWLLAINVLSELRAIAMGSAVDAEGSSKSTERVERALAASEEEWYGLREWLARRGRLESASQTGVRCPDHTFPLDAFPGPSPNSPSYN